MFFYIISVLHSMWLAENGSTSADSEDKSQRLKMKRPALQNASPASTDIELEPDMSRDIDLKVYHSSPLINDDDILEADDESE